MIHWLSTTRGMVWTLQSFVLVAVALAFYWLYRLEPTLLRRAATKQQNKLVFSPATLLWFLVGGALRSLQTMFYPHKAGWFAPMPTGELVCGLLSAGAMGAAFVGTLSAIRHVKRMRASDAASPAR